MTDQPTPPIVPAPAPSKKPGPLLWILLLLAILAWKKLGGFDPLALIFPSQAPVTLNGSVEVSPGKVSWPASKGKPAGSLPKSPDADVDLSNLNGSIVAKPEAFGFCFDPVVGAGYAGNEKDPVNDAVVGARIFFIGPWVGAAAVATLERFGPAADARFGNVDVFLAATQAWTSPLDLSTVRPMIGFAFFPFDAPGKVKVENP